MVWCVLAGQGLDCNSNNQLEHTSSYKFCFDGVEKNSIVAVGVVGCKHNKAGFMRGYNAMLERLEPETILCFGAPFPEIQGNIVAVDYMTSRKVVR